MLNVREQAAVVETGEQSLNEVLFELGQHGLSASRFAYCSPLTAYFVLREQRARSILRRSNPQLRENDEVSFLRCTFPLALRERGRG